MAAGEANLIEVRILVTDGNSRAALAVCRSLGAKGHHIIVGHHRTDSLASASRHCKDRCIYPDPATHPNLFLGFLEDFVKFHSIDVLIPITDITTLPIAEHRNRFEPACKVPFASFSAISRAANKVDIAQLAQSLGVGVPKSIILHRTDDLREGAFDLPFPVVIKPGRSRIQTDNGWIYTSVIYAGDFDSLERQLRKLNPLAFPVLLQERITGPCVGIFMCYQNGKPAAAFSHQRLREKPPSGGVSVLSESIPLDPLALCYSEKLLDELQWNGVAMVEFKRDEQDGKLKLMEINGRFWGSLQLAIDAGVDFPALLIDTNKIKAESDYHYEIGVRLRWLVGDIDALLMRLFKSDEILQLPHRSSSKLQYLLQFLEFWGPGLRYEVLRWDDIQPGLLEIAQWTKNWATNLVCLKPKE